MMTTWYLARKDFFGIVKSPMFFMIAAICTGIWFVFFMRSMMMFEQQSLMSASNPMLGGEGGLNIHQHIFLNHLALVNFFLIFVVPALTMRSFAEEKRQRSFDFLLTAPISSTQIAIGKFLGCVLAVWLLVATSLIFPFSMGFIASFDYMPLVSSSLGILLGAACYVAVGVMASSLTDSGVIAVVLAAIGNIMLWFFSNFFEGAEGSFWQALRDQVAFGNHFGAFLKGGPKLSALMFFASVIVLFVFVTQRIVESHRWR